MKDWLRRIRGMVGMGLTDEETERLLGKVGR